MKNSGYHGNLRVPMPPLNKALFPGGGGIAGGPLDSHEVICCFLGGIILPNYIGIMMPSREPSHIPPWGKENHRLKSALGKGYVSSQEGKPL